MITACLAHSNTFSNGYIFKKNTESFVIVSHFFHSFQNDFKMYLNLKLCHYSSIPKQVDGIKPQRCLILQTISGEFLQSTEDVRNSLQTFLEKFIYVHFYVYILLYICMLTCYLKALLCF